MSFITIQEVSSLDLALIVLGAVLCLASYCLRLVFHLVRYRGNREIVGIRLLIIVITLGYLGWGYWSAADPVKMSVPARLALGGGIPLTAAGLALFVLSETKHRGAEEEALITTGIYAKLRHPMYVALVLLHLGYPLIYRSFAALSSTFLWIAFMAVWVRFEEKRLERRFGAAYRAYRESSWF
jgi:protein-S-isoprenylcysteine O-methyltransferase Ste14